jgi:hypothetical protein
VLTTDSHRRRENILHLDPMLPTVAEIVVVVEARTREFHGAGQSEQVLIAHLISLAGRAQVAPRYFKSVEVRVVRGRGPSRLSLHSSHEAVG